jgi:hypothetical protein
VLVLFAKDMKELFCRDFVHYNCDQLYQLHGIKYCSSDGPATFTLILTAYGSLKKNEKILDGQAKYFFKSKMPRKMSQQTFLFQRFSIKASFSMCFLLYYECKSRFHFANLQGCREKHPLPPSPHSAVKGDVV